MGALGRLMRMVHAHERRENPTFARSSGSFSALCAVMSQSGKKGVKFGM